MTIEDTTDSSAESPTPNSVVGKFGRIVDQAGADQVLATLEGQQDTGDEGDDNYDGEGQRTFSADYVSKLRKEAAEARKLAADARKYRAEAKIGADAVRRLAEIEDANKTEAQRLADAKSAAEAEAAAARAEALRWKIAAKHGVSADEAELFLTATDEDTMTRQAEALAAMRAKTVTPTSTTTPAAPPAAPPAPRADLSQGARGSTSSDPRTAFAAHLAGQLNR